MQKLLLLLFIMAAFSSTAQSPVGNWKVVSHTVDMDGQKIDMHAALLQQRPCAAKIYYAINADGTYRLMAANSGCEERYRSIQEKLYSNTQWKVESGVITTSATNFAVGQSYTLTFADQKMIWTGTEGQGVIVYERI